MAPEHLHVERHSAAGYDLVTLTGELDIVSGAPLRRLALEAGHDQARLVVDLSEVSFMDSSGIGTLVSMRREARSRGAELELVCPDGPVLRVLTMVKLDQVIPVHDSLDDALGWTVDGVVGA
jgi:anti-anti-sigma factor